MHRAAIRGPRGQLAPPGAGGAVAAASFSAPTRRRSGAPPGSRTLLFLSLSRALNPLVSSNCARPRDRAGRCYLLLRGVTAAVTRKPLFPHGFRGVLPSYRQGGAFDVQTSARARASAFPSLYGNIGNNGYYLYVSVTCALLRPLPARVGGGNRVTIERLGSCRSPWSNILRGGYSVELAGGADQHRPGGGASRNFRAPIGLELGRDLVGLAGVGNGSFPPLSGSGSGVVGTVLLERPSQGLGIARVSGPARKLCQQAAAGELGADAGQAGGCPPQAADRSDRVLALDVGRFWIGVPCDRTERPQNSTPPKGLGVSGELPRNSGRLQRAARIQDRDDRVGDGRPSGSMWQSELPATFSREVAHVNG